MARLCELAWLPATRCRATLLLLYMGKKGPLVSASTLQNGGGSVFDGSGYSWARLPRGSIFSGPRRKLHARERTRHLDDAATAAGGHRHREPPLLPRTTSIGIPLSAGTSRPHRSVKNSRSALHPPFVFVRVSAAATELGRIYYYHSLSSAILPCKRPGREGRARPVRNPRGRQSRSDLLLLRLMPGVCRARVLTRAHTCTRARSAPDNGCKKISYAGTCEQPVRQIRSRRQQRGTVTRGR